MFASSSLKERVGLWIFLALFAVSNVQSKVPQSQPISCTSSQLLCGGSMCYDPITQYCTESGMIVECIDVCGNQCYNPSTHQCFNETVCESNEQLCMVKYNSDHGYEQNPPYYQCYNPMNYACFNNSFCQYPSRSCNQQCIRYDEICVNNMTICNVTDQYYNYQDGQIQLCDGECYDSAIEQCTNDTIRCIDDCSGVCYNSSSHQCFNETVCELNEQLCMVKYNSDHGYEQNPPYYQCYNPMNYACFNNSLCQYPSRSCDQQCIRYNEICVNNMTVCNVTGPYYNYQDGQIQLCDGECYDSAIQQCTNDTIRCIDDCSGVCYNSSSHQCFNGTVCELNEQLCMVKYNSDHGYEQNPPYYQCYNPMNYACFNNSLCQYPSRSCDQQCIRYNEICVNNMTVCNVTSWYHNYRAGQIQLCNGVCYDSAIQKCGGGHSITNLTSNSSTITLTSTTTSISTTTVSASSNCGSLKECTTDADCCVSGIECECFRHNNQEYGSCLNPYAQPICATGCPAQGICRIDTDCCKFQCGQITVTDAYGSHVTKFQCVPR